ncbi:T9SS type A sorting domain-containing protein [Flavobacterium sp. CYK-4]|uniref:endo-beta-N-acetylglucosaminidase n=1 Tax=Flavobacterium lotistagni TaxID=2709660 RepID=UPI00140DE9D4|nr:T9SS type A sorting domain-containing protein [Flavobacterium lotistagni]NHM05916.1 T9SS type A sorting domain-containing protein [Flavobacterium lotistagni]
MKKITLLALLLLKFIASAQIVNTAPYILTIDELKAWTPTGATASDNLISTVPLATRFINTATQTNPALSNDMKIAYLPDGMNNFGNYYGEQSQFNLYNFTHWQYIDKLVWFGGTASQTVQLPSSPWANAAHKNGVKVFGNVFFAPTAFGGSTATLTNFLEQDGSGNFVVIPKMIAMMQHYNFDGWFINQETATNATTAGLMHDFVRDLSAQAESLGKEVMWYDAMRLNGVVGWQNRLNAVNSPFVQDDADLDGSFETRVSSNIFINFFWSSNAFPTASRTRAQLIGRSQFDVFTGVDIWPGRNQGNFETSGNTFMTNLHENATTPYTSLGIFAPNCVYNNSTFSNFNNDPADYASFYNAENHLFSGDDNNPANVDATGFKGLCNWIPEASVINTLPFNTDFCTGHGLKKFANGTQISSDSWHDMNAQDILPTWQWAFSQNNTLTANWDFTDAYSKGNSIKITGNLPTSQAIDLPLYQTKLSIGEGIFRFNIAYKNANPNDSKMKLFLIFTDEPGQKYEFPITYLVGLSNNWSAGETVIGSEYSTREIAVIGLRFETDEAVAGYSINVGEISIENVVLGIDNYIRSNNFVTVSYPAADKNIVFNLNWPATKELQYVVSDLQGKVVTKNTISLHGPMSYPFPTGDLAAGTYIVKFTDASNHFETRKIIIK